ncbi:fap1 adhesin-like isoform X2 [Palaemon carinicauda]|uniref:fap1 adhesin-like isoform X2 n=1 Tax=Palaemon carinicauda TaxID=392227 RepID=UPI0035B61854
MDAARQIPPRPAVPLDDLDLQPVRELRHRVLNEIDKETEARLPRVQFNYVDVSFPKPPSKKGSHVGSIDKIKSHKRSHKSRNVTSHLLGSGSESDGVRYTSNQMAEGNQQNIADDGRRQFISQILRKGVPVWEEVPQAEINARGFADPHRHQNHPALNITTRTSQRTQRMSKVPSAVWEDVTEGSSCYTQGERLPPDPRFVGHRQKYRSGVEQNELKTPQSSSVSSSPSRSSRSSTHTYTKEGETGVYTSKGSHKSPSPQNVDARSPLEEHSSIENSQGSAQSQKDVLSWQDMREADAKQSQAEQERPLRIMKRKFGGRLVDDTNIITARSWRVGEKAVLEKYGSPSKAESIKKKESDAKEEEEKHEKEPTKEVPRKRDLSAPSQVSERPAKKPNKNPDTVAPPKENIPAAPPRVRNYEVKEVRKFMEKKRRERTKSYQEQKRLEEINQIEKEERLKKLALKTKEVAHHKEMKETDGPGPVSKASNQINNKPPTQPNWGCPSDCNHDSIRHDNVPSTFNKEKSIAPHPVPESPKKDAGNNVQNEKNNQMHQNSLKEHSSQRETEAESRALEKQRSKDRKKKERKKLNVSSESLSDLVSRTVEECDKRLKSSSVSLSGISTPSSIDLSEGEIESSSSYSESSSVDTIPDRRVVALGEVAQKLTSRINKEEENLKHFVISNKGKGRAPSHEWQQANFEAEKGPHIGRTNDATSGSGVGPGNAHPDKAMLDPLPYSELNMLSVEQIKARMTAMLLQNASTVQSKSGQNINKGDKEELKKSLSDRITTRIQNRNLQSPPREEIPCLLIPDTPSLHLSSSSRVPFAFGLTTRHKDVDPRYDRHYSARAEGNPESLDKLPGNNVDMVSQKPRSVAPHNVQSKSSTAWSHDSGHHYNPSERNKFETAATCIQAAYRGLRVRKITSSLLKNKSNSKNVASPSKGTQTQGNSTDHNKRSREMHSKLTSDGSTKQTQKIDWRKIRQELDSEFNTPKRKSSYTFQRKDLPQWIKPYVVLSESGNVDNFIKTNTEPDHDSSLGKSKQSSSAVKEVKNVNPFQSDSDKENVKDPNNSMLNDTLTGGPISDLEEKDIVLMSEKETQTHFRSQRPKKKAEEKFGNGKAVRHENTPKFVNLKPYDNERGPVLLEMSESTKKEYSLNGNTDGRVLSLSGKKDKNKGKSYHFNETINQNDTLEEGLISDMDENVSDDSKHDSKRAVLLSPEDTEEIECPDSSDVLESGEISKRISSPESLPPHQLLGKGPHFAPANLRLRLNAELMYQDTVNEALNQLQGAEQLHVLTRDREREFAVSQSLLAQQQEEEAYKKMRAEEEKQKKAEEEERKANKEFRRKELQIQQEALSTVERIEREAKERLDQLEKEVRARAEQIMIASQRPPEHSNTHPEFIATAAVAAVGATMSQWEKLKQLQGIPSGILASQSSVTHSQVTSISNSHSQRYTDSGTRSQSKVSTNKSFSSKKTSGNSGEYSSVSEKISIISKEKSSVIEELSSVNHSSGSSVEELVESEIESARSVVSESSRSVISEVTKISRSYKTSHSDSEIPEAESLKSAVTSGPSVNTESIKTSISEGEKVGGLRGNQRSSRSKEKSPAPHFKKSETSTENVSEVLSVPDLSIGKSISKVVSESIPSEVNEMSKSDMRSTSVPSSEVKESIPYSLPSTSKGLEISTQDSSTKESQSIQESLGGSRPSVSQTPTKTSSSANRQKEESGVGGGHYSESFEVESMSDNSSKSLEISRKRNEKDYQGDLSLVVSGNLLAAVDPMGYKGTSQLGKNFPGSALAEGGNHTALGMTLSLVESLQKEEEVRLQHLTALIKLQEQSLIEEAKWKITALQAEGGPRLRRRQDAVVRQLREQRSHLHRLIETQNLAAQQRRLILLQHHHLLATTSGLSSGGNKAFPTVSRGHSPNPSSPRLTPRMMEISISSSSEGQEDLSLHLSVKSKETGSSSLSDSSGREKRRSHSDERKRIVSARLQEKRRAAEGDPLNKSKSLFDSQEKELMKTKRKIDMVTKRSRDKREKSPITAVRMGESAVSTESSVPEESIDASTHESQSSVAEEAGSESVSHSDVASSVSEHEGTSSRKEPSYSIPTEYGGTEKSSSIREVLTNSQRDLTPSSSKNVSSHVKKSTSKTESVRESSRNTLVTPDSGSTIKTASTESHETNKTSDVPTILSDKLSVQTKGSTSAISEAIESSNKPSGTHSTVQTGSSVASEKHSKSRDGSSTMEGSGTSKSNLTTSKNASHVLETDSSSSRVSDVKSTQRSSGRALPLPLRVPLSPRSPHRQHRRYSSESDDSFTLSQTETASDVSDGEGKLIALKEQLAIRRAEADRLRREKRRLRRERLTSQEQALRQQIANYDTYIQQAKLELERESKELQQASQVRPLIKRPQVAESKKLKQSESLLVSPEKSDISDTSILSECSKSDQSVSSKSQEARTDHSLTSRLKNLKGDPPLPSKSQDFDSRTQPQLQRISESQKPSDVLAVDSSVKKTSHLAKDDSKKTREESPQVTQEEVESSKESSTSISEDYSFEEESGSSQSVADSQNGTLSRESSQDTDQSQSQASSTETIVHSPKKLSLSQKDGEISQAELSQNLPQEEKSELVNNSEDSKIVGNLIDKLADLPVAADEEVEKKLDIFIPTSHAKSEGDESSYQDKDTSAEESISEEIAEPSQVDVIKESDSLHSNKDILNTGISLDEDVGQSLNSYKETDTVSKVDSEIQRDSLPIQDKRDVEDQSDVISRGTSLNKQKQVDDISNSIFVSLMKETTTLFSDIMKQKDSNKKESSNLLMPSQENLKTDSYESSSLKKPVDQEHVSAGRHDMNIASDKEGHSEAALESKSQVLKRVRDLNAENDSSPRSMLNSPRTPGLHITPQLTFDISPDNLSPVSPTPVSPPKLSKEVDPAENAAEPGIPSTSAADHDSQGASPTHDIAKAEDYSLDMEFEGENFAIDPDALTSKLLNLSAAPDIDLDSKLDLVEGEAEFSVEGIEGTWFDDSFWASSDTKKKQQQLKAEEERIAAEIARLEELQRLSEQYPGLVIREVPNKPPPPYTPPPPSSPMTTPSSPVATPSPSPTPSMPPAYRPASPEGQMSPEVPAPSSCVSMPHRLSKADLRKLATEIFHVVPSSQEEVIPLVVESFEMIYVSFENGVDPSTVEPPSKYLPSSPNIDPCDDTSEEEEESCARIFSLLIFSLTRELLGEIYNLQRTPAPPPWIKQSLPHTPLLMIAYTKSKKILMNHVMDNVKGLFGWKIPGGKESLMLRWARKHRDLVDQVLVKELQAEEANWTCYDKDEAFVKLRAAEEIFTCLLDETIRLFSKIIAKKMAFT